MDFHIFTNRGAEVYSPAFRLMFIIRKGSHNSQYEKPMTDSFFRQTSKIAMLFNLF